MKSQIKKIYNLIILIILSTTIIIPVYAADSHGMTYFPSDHIWNTPIKNLTTIHPNSSFWINNLKTYGNVEWCQYSHPGVDEPENLCDNLWSTRVPINWVNSTISHVAVEYVENGPPSGNSDWWDAPLTSDIQIQSFDSGADDYHCIVVDTDENRVYEFFQMYHETGTDYNCTGEFVWNLSEYRLLNHTRTSAGQASVNAAGTPYIAGMIKYDELNSGNITHAISGVITNVNQSIVWPGTHKPASNPTNGSFPGYSDRLRLKASVNISGFYGQNKTIAQALKDYGVIIMDRGSSGISLIVENDSRIGSLPEVRGLELDDFEFVDESALFINWSTAQANQEPLFNYSYSFAHISDLQKWTDTDTDWYIANDTFQDLEGWKSTYNISAIFVTGDLTDTGYDAEFLRYIGSRNYTTIPTFEVMGNHDFDGGTDGCCGNYANWTEHIGERNFSVNSLQHFAVYGLSWDNGDTFPPGVWAPMNAFFDDNPTKTPMIFTHRFLSADYSIDPIGNDTLVNMNHDKNTIVMSGHDYPSDPVQGRVVQFCNGSINVMADIVDPQVNADIQFGRLYQVIVTNGEVSNLNISTMWFTENKINETVSYNFVSNTTCAGGSAPVASFSTNVTSGVAQLPVGFNDTSTNSPTSWNWSFRNVTGNNTEIWFSTSQNSSLVFGVGNYSIKLNATNSMGSNISSQTTFINVSGGFTTVFYADNTNWDARFTRAVTGQTWSAIRDGAGTAILNTSIGINGAYLVAHSTSNQWNLHARFGWSANTSSIPDNAIIDSAIFVLNGQSGNTSGLGGITSMITGFTPTNYAILAASDYSEFTQDLYSENLTYASWKIGLNNYTLTNKSFINKTGITSLMVRNQWDVNNTAPTWSNGALSNLVFNDTSAGGDNRPFLQVTYYLEETYPPVSSFTANATSGTTSLPVGFNDTSTNSPTSWNWSFRNITGNNTEVWFSTLQNSSLVFGIGNYSIKLNATNSVGSNISSQTTFINVSAITEIFYSLSNTSQGLVSRSVTNEAFTTIRSGAGTSNTNTTINRTTRILAGSSTWATLNRYGWVGNTSGLPDNAVIDSAEIGLYWDNINHTGLGNAEHIVTGFNPSNDAVLSMSDYALFTDDKYSANLSTLNWVNESYTYISLTNTSFINKTGNTKWMLRLVWDAWNTSPSWSNGASSGIGFYHTPNPGTDKDPLLRITYHIGEEIAPVASFTANATSGSSPLPVGFTDTSTNTPTSWNWSFNNITGNSTEIWFSTLQNPSLIFGVGNYSIKLNTSNSMGSNISAQTTFINVSSGELAPVSSFTANVTNGASILPVGFTDTSTNSPTSWNWSFKNVTGNNTEIWFSTLQNSSSLFGTGNFLIKLNATNSMGSNISSQTTFINVSEGVMTCVQLNSSYSGRPARDGVNEVFSTIRNGAGTEIDIDAGISIVASSTNNQFATLRRTIHVWNTSIIPDDIISIDHANITVHGNNIGEDGLGTTLSGIAVTGVVPDNPTIIIAGDYDNFNDTLFSDFIPITSWSNTSNNTFQLNNAGITNINISGLSSFGIRHSWDINNTMSGTWESGKYVARWWRTNGSTSQKPILEVCYLDEPTSPIASFTSNVTIGVTPLPVGFTDSSTGPASSWNWSFKNVTGNNTEIWFSTLQNPSSLFGTGNFSIKLNATNSAGSNISSQTTFINVTPQGSGVLSVYPLRYINNTRILPTSDANLPPAGLNVSINITRGNYEASSFIIKPNIAVTDMNITATDLTDGVGHTIYTNATTIQTVKVWWQNSGIVNPPWTWHDLYAGGTTPGTTTYALTPELLLNNDSIVRVNYTTQQNELWIKNSTFEGYFHVDNTTIGQFPEDAIVFDNATISGFPQLFTIPSTHNKQIWMTTYIPVGQPAGNYTGTVWLNSSSTSPVAVNFTIRVLPFNLTNSSVLHGIYYNKMYNASHGIAMGNNTQRSPAIMEAEYQDIYNHGVMYPTLHHHLNDNASIDGDLSIRDIIGFPKDRIFGVSDVSMTDSWFYTGNGTSASYLEGVQSKVLIIRNLTEGHGYTKTYMYGIDEGDSVVMQSERPVWKTIHDNGSYVWASGSTSLGDTTVVADVLDILNLDHALNATAAGIYHSYNHEIFVYGNPQTGLEQPETYRKYFGLSLWEFYDGGFDYSYQAKFGQSVWNDYDNGLEYRDHVFAYPTSTGVVDTVQWEGYREGVDDARYADTLTTLTGSNTSAKTIINDNIDTSDMSEIRKLLIDEILESMNNAPVSSFTANVTSGASPLSVGFTDTSTYTPTSWNWSFKNVTGNNTEIWFSTLQNPSLVFDIGNFLIKLNATNSAGSNISAQTTFINVSEEATPVASFTSNVTNGTPPLAVGFTDTSTNTPTGWRWYFGDESYNNSWNIVNTSPGWTTREYGLALSLPDGSIVYIGGYDWGNHYMNDTWRSTDGGATWTEMCSSCGFSPRKGAAGAALSDGSIVIHGGSSGTTNSEAWRSTDNGATWTMMSSDTGTSQYHHIIQALPNGTNNDTLVMYTGSSLDQNISHSEDLGATWHEHSNVGSFTPRSYTSGAKLPDNSILFMGGLDANTNYLNDTWRSSDRGLSWTQVNASSGWASRGSAASAVMPDGSILIAGGFNGSSAIIPNDVWRSNNGGATWSQINASFKPGDNEIGMSMAVSGTGSAIIIGSSIYNDDNTYQLNPYTSTIQNPSHTYSTEGTFNVTLLAYNSFGFNTSLKHEYITVNATSAPVSSFTANITSGNAPLSVGFTDTSTNTPSSWNWSFRNTTGNDTEVWFSTSQNPSKIFNTGNFSIKLNTSNSMGYNITPGVYYINVTTKPSTSTLILTGANLTDGVMERTTDGNWSDIRTGAGTYASGSGTTLWVVAGTTGTTDVYSKITISEFIANTSYIPDDAVVASAKLVIKTNSKNNQIGNPEIVIINTSDTNSGFATSDYQARKWGNYSEAIPYNSFTVGAFTNISFNSAGVASINKTGRTFFVLSTSWDSSNNPPAFVASSESYVSFYAADYTGTSSDPYLEIIYDESLPVASFTSNVTNGSSPLIVSFTDTSSDATAWNWSFRNVTGNNTEIWFSTLQNPIQTFNVGNFSIKLNASRLAGFNITPELYYINVTQPLAPIADFSSNELFGYAPFEVQFYDNSTGGTPTSWYWEFDDGNTSTEQNPTHIFTNCNEGFNISFRATNSNASSWMNKTDYISTFYCYPPSVGFIAEPTSGPAPLEVMFTDVSSSEPSPIAWFWDFGDGNTSTEINTPHTYTTCGESYSINHSATNIYGTEWQNASDYITTDPCPQLPLSITNITNITSYNTINWSWTNPPNLNFNHTYIMKDNVFYTNTSNTTSMLNWTGLDSITSYTFSSRTCNPSGSCNATWVNLTSTTNMYEVPPFADFYTEPTEYCDPAHVFLTDLSTELPTNWDWYFGNGTKFSDSPSPDIWLSSGVYTINLHVSNGGGEDWMNKTNYITVFECNPPKSITNLANITGDVWINWSWTNPTDSDFNYTYIMKDNVFYTNASNTTTTINWTGLDSPASYTFSSRTCDLLGTCNTTWVNLTSTTNMVEVIPFAEFEAMPTTSGCDPLTIGFTDLSTELPTNWDWYWYNNETKSSDIESPMDITFTAGTYSVRLYASNGAGGEWENKTDYITVFECVPSITNLANITSYNMINWSWTNPSHPHFNHTYIMKDNVFYTNTSNTTSMLNWTELDSITSYTFSSRTCSLIGYCNATWVNLTSTTNMYEVPPFANFYTEPTEYCAPAHVFLTDLSTELPTNWDWYFGNGTKFSDDPSPDIWLSTGVYTINLHVSNGGGEDWMNRTNYVTVEECDAPTASFTSNVTSGIPLLPVLFTDTSTGNASGWFWYFRDVAGNNTEVLFSTLQNPIHIFNTGNFFIKLNALNGFGNDTSDGSYFVNVTPPSPINASFIASQWYASDVPFTISFVDTSTGSPNTWYWDFGDKGTSTLQNPSHVYSKGGLYSVTLIASNTATGASDSETCVRCMNIKSSPEFNYSGETSTLDIVNSTGMQEWMYYMLVTNKTTSEWEFPIIGFASGIMSPFTSAFETFGVGSGMYVYLILWGLFIMMVWRQSGKITIPALIACITAGAWGLLFPESAQPWVQILLCVAIASQLFTFFTKE